VEATGFLAFGFVARRFQKILVCSPFFAWRSIDLRTTIAQSGVPVLLKGSQRNT
jgi:hypothetical protein